MNVRTLAVLLPLAFLPLGGCVTAGLAAASALTGAIATADRLGAFEGAAGTAVDVAGALRRDICKGDGPLAQDARAWIRERAARRGVTPEQLRTALCR